MPALVLVLLIAAGPARAQLLEGGAREIALGRAGVAVSGDAWAEANPAAWASLAGMRVETFASQSFGLPELRVGAVAVAVPTRTASLALAARAFGPPAYRELRLTAGAARQLQLAAARRIAVGLRADVHASAIEGFGTVTVADASLGAQFDVTPRLRAGLAARYIAGILRPDSADLRAPLSASPALVAGMAYSASPATIILLACDKDLEYPAIVRAGIEVVPHRALAIRAGAATAAAGVPLRLTVGGGFRAGRVEADVAVEWHEVLGPSPAFGLALQL